MSYKYSDRAQGEILCLHRQTPGSTFPPPSSSQPLHYSRTRVREKQASPCHQLHDLSMEGTFALPLVTPGTWAFLEVNKSFQSSTISKADTRVRTLQSKTTRPHGQRGRLPFRTRGSLPSRLSDSSTIWSGWEGITLLGSLVFSS